MKNSLLAIIYSIIIIGIALLVPNIFMLELIKQTIFNVNILVISILSLSFFPLYFFSAAIATCELRKSHILLKTIVNILFIGLLISIAYLIIGSFWEWILPNLNLELTNLNVTSGPQDEISILISDNLNSLDIFKIIRQVPTIIFSLSILAVITGLVFYPDKEIAEPTYNLFDSLSRLTFVVNSFIFKWLAIPLIFLLLSFFININSILALERFYGVFLLLLISSGCIILGLIPLILYIFAPEQNPYKWLFLNIRHMILAFFSADLRLMLCSIIADSKNKLSISRSHNGFTVPISYLFIRPGTLLVLSLCFGIVYQTHNRLEQDFLAAIYWRFLIPVLITIIVNLIDFKGISLALVIMFLLYKTGLTNGYTVILPILFVLQSVATLLDAVAIAAINQIIFSRHLRSKIAEHKNSS